MKAKRETPEIPLPPDQPHTPPIEDPPDNQDLQTPNPPVREPDPPGPKRL